MTLTELAPGVTLDEISQERGELQGRQHGQTLTEIRRALIYRPCVECAETGRLG